MSEPFERMSQYFEQMLMYFERICKPFERFVEHFKRIFFRHSNGWRTEKRTVYPFERMTVSVRFAFHGHNCDSFDLNSNTVYILKGKTMCYSQNKVNLN